MRLLAPLLLVGLLAAPSHAIYLPPDLVQIPVDRLVTNLERQLAAAEVGTPKYGSLRLALARVHAAAYARKSSVTSVWSTVSVTAEVPKVTEGEADTNNLRGYLGQALGRSPVQTLSTPRRSDKDYQCDPRALAERMDLDGTVTIGFTVPGGKEGARNAIENLRVVRSDIGDDNVGRCAASKLAGYMVPVKPKAATVEMDFTFKSDTSELRPFYGFGDVTVPPHTGPAADAEAEAAAKAHLEKARSLYYQAVKADPENALVHLGLAWTLEQLGLKKEAKTCYLKTFDIAWKREKEIKHLGLGSAPIAGEAARYVLPLLDPDKDADTISKIADAQQQLMRLPRPVTPILLPLTADGPHDLASLVDADASVAFDLDGTGLPRRWGWIRPAAGWLVWDQTGEGVVRSGLQLFGSVSFWAFWADGYQALAALDDDGDARISGAELRGLAIWHDADSDGVSDPGEVRPLAAWGVVALETRAQTDADGMPMHAAGAVFADGATRPTYDWSPTGRLTVTP